MACNIPAGEEVFAPKAFLEAKRVWRKYCKCAHIFLTQGAVGC